MQYNSTIRRSKQYMNYNRIIGIAQNLLLLLHHRYHQNKKRIKFTAFATNPSLSVWYNEIDFSESEFYHEPSSTLIVTDCVVNVTKDRPLILQEDPRALLYHSRDFEIWIRYPMVIPSNDHKRDGQL